MTVLGDEGFASVEPYAVGRSDQGIVAKPAVLGGVEHDQPFACGHRMGAEGDVARRLFEGDAAAGLEPLAVGVDQLTAALVAPKAAQARRARLSKSASGEVSTTPSRARASRRAASVDGSTMRGGRGALPV